MVGSQFNTDGNALQVPAPPGGISSLGLNEPAEFLVSTPNPLVSNGAFTITWRNRILDDFSGVSSFSFGTRVGFDSSALASFNYQSRILFDNTGVITSLNYLLRTANDNANRVSINYQNRILEATTGIFTVDWQGGTLSNRITGNVSISWQTYEQFDSANRVSINYTNRTDINSSGITIIDWQNNLANDNTGIVFMKWVAGAGPNNRTINDSAGNIVWDINLREGFDSSGNPTIDIQTQTLIDNTFVTSLNWLTRDASDTIGRVAMNYNTRDLIAPDGVTSVFNWATPMGNPPNTSIVGALPLSIYGTGGIVLTTPDAGWIKIYDSVSNHVLSIPAYIST